MPLEDNVWRMGSRGQTVSRAEPTYFERVIGHVQQMALWQRVVLALVLLGLPLAIAYLEVAFAVDVQTPVLNQDTWRTAYFPTVIVIYIIAVVPWIWRAESEVIAALRPLVNDAFDSQELLAHKSWWRSSLGDWVAFSLGSLGGALLLLSQPPTDLQFWAIRYWIATLLIMYGALAWLIYVAMGSAAWTALLHRHVSHKDPFDPTPFEPVGRQGLILAMIFIGAITLSLLFIYTREMFSEWRGIAIYSILVLVTVSIFFTVMWPAHRILSQVKAQKVESVQRTIGQTFHKLETLAGSTAETQPLATEMQAWLALEQRLKQTRTWPYDTEMLRNLFLSVLTPLFVAIARVVGIYVTEGHF
jgi:hypothetical protein